MQTLYAPVSAIYESKQSKFIAHLVPYRDFETLLKRLQAEHPKARHFVTAFRHVNEFSQIVEGSSDDGEPRGTSGKPSLAVLAGHDLIDTAVIIVRYFGGTKLGTGGLVRAYTHAVSDAVKIAQLGEYIPLKHAMFACTYSDVSKVEYLLNSGGVEVIEKRFEVDAVVWSISAGSQSLQAFFDQAGRLVEKQGDS